jgi:protein-disulfide isomerase
MSVLAALVLFAPAVPAQDSLFQLDGLDYGRRDLPANVQQSLFDADLQHFRSQRRLAEDGAVALYLESEAKRRGESPDDIRDELLAVPDPSDTEVEAFYNANRQRIPYSLDQVRDQIVSLLREQSLVGRKAALVEELEAKGTLKMLISAPQPPQVEINLEGRPTKGPPQAPVTLVEFADFQCPHCKDAAPVVDALLQRYGDRLRLVYMDFPVNPSGISTKVAEGGVCAAQQDRFWEYHDLAFEQQAALDAGSPLALAQILELDEALFSTCLEEPATAAEVARSKAEAERIGVSATPTFYVNGRLAILEDLGSGLRVAIDEALANRGG